MSSPMLILLFVIFAGISVATLVTVRALQNRRLHAAGPRETVTSASPSAGHGTSFDAGSSDCGSDGGGGGCD